MTKQEIERRIERLSAELNSCKQDLANWGAMDQTPELSVRWVNERCDYRLVLKLPDGTERFIDLS